MTGLAVASYDRTNTAAHSRILEGVDSPTPVVPCPHRGYPRLGPPPAPARLRRQEACGRSGRAMVNVGVRVSGGDLLLGSLHGLTVAEADALDHLGQPLRAVQPAPAALGGLGELVDHRQGRLP